MLNIPFLWKRRIIFSCFIIAIIYFFEKLSGIKLTNLPNIIDAYPFLLLLAILGFLLVGKNLAQEVREYRETTKND